ncbi:MBL fold metallo-hydrolase [Pelobacter seleniigenes]|uniref:MBL fold metallo-hydrolase n=1 Tax=Pelobacter seleniigenes TaxID=407188 RepID=UPI00068D7226|nr:hypothetical protein [Pelobacter seleniigenes]
MKKKAWLPLLLILLACLMTSTTYADSHNKWGFNNKCEHNQGYEKPKPKATSIYYKWNGYAFGEIILPNGKSIIIDPYYKNVSSNEYNYTVYSDSKTAADPEITKGTDYVIFSHNHFDHTNDFRYLLERNPAAYFIIPAGGVNSFFYNFGVEARNINFQPFENYDYLVFPDFTLETFRASHTKKIKTSYPADLNDGRSADDPLAYLFWNEGTTEYFNFRITTNDGFVILIVGGQYKLDPRMYNYVGTEPDLMIYQMAAVNIGTDGIYYGDRSAPLPDLIAGYVASINPRVAIPGHHEKFSVDLMDKFTSDLADLVPGTNFPNPETHVWYKLSKRPSGKVSYMMETPL